VTFDVFCRGQRNVDLEPCAGVVWESVRHDNPSGPPTFVARTQWRRPGAEFGGDGKFFRGPKISEWRFSEKISISRPKFHGQKSK